MKVLMALCLSLALVFCFPVLAYTGTLTDSDNKDSSAHASSIPDLTLTSSSALLMDADTGMILFEQNASEKRPLASVTKVMTLLLIFRALDNGQIHLGDSVTVSAHAAGMGGSQVYLEEGDIPAPVKKGDIIGKALYYFNKQNIGSIDLLAAEDIPLLTLKDAWMQILSGFFLHAFQTA